MLTHNQARPYVYQLKTSSTETVVSLQVPTGKFFVCQEVRALVGDTVYNCAIQVNSTAKTLEVIPQLVPVEMFSSKGQNGSVSAVKKQKIGFANGDIIRLKIAGNSGEAKIGILGYLYSSGGGM